MKGVKATEKEPEEAHASVQISLYQWSNKLWGFLNYVHAERTSHHILGWNFFYQITDLDEYQFLLHLLLTIMYRRWAPTPHSMKGPNGVQEGLGANSSGHCISLPSVHSHSESCHGPSFSLSLHYFSHFSDMCGFLGGASSDGEMAESQGLSWGTLSVMKKMKDLRCLHETLLRYLHCFFPDWLCIHLIRETELSLWLFHNESVKVKLMDQYNKLFTKKRW